VYRLEFSSTPEGAPCVRLVTVGADEGSGFGSADAEARFLTLVGTMERCPGSAEAVTTTPLIEATRFWRTMSLPDLEPRIAPGRALVGWPTYLETGGEASVAAGADTPLGPLTITASRRTTVDWDDGPGSVTGPHDGSGGPHPTGDITWVYGRSGPRDIAVTQTWTATWRIGSATGTLGGRGTTATLAAFPVEQVQAVRTR
jgi:hypothetical protein